MKGTLFSADFVKDLDGNLRLLEVNTDTSTVTNNLSYFNYDEFISVLSDNNITKVTIIHKPHMHTDMVNHLSASLSTNAPFVTTITEVKETIHSIFPTFVEDESDLFILRLAYDDSAILDGEYANGELNLLKLFADYNESDLVTQFHHSSSLHGEYNTLDLNFNPSNVPDCVVRGVSENEALSFYKIGSESETDTNESRWDSFINAKSNENTLIQQYYIHPNTISDNKVSSIRAYSIVYGSNLDLISIAEYETHATFELPVDTIYNPNLYVNEIDSKHYFEFATNTVKYSPSAIDGLLNTHLIIKADSTLVEAGNLVVGDEIKSYYVNNTLVNETERFDEFFGWQSEGDAFPSGSYLTSSVVVFKQESDLMLKSICNINVNEDDGDSIYVAPNKSFLVYDSLLNVIKWKMAFTIVPTTDFLLDYDGSTAEVTFNDFIVINEDTFSLIQIDVEDTDTYIIAGSTPINSFVTHNAPCFVAGTKIKMADGSIKNIEEVVSGDIVSTFDLTENKIVPNEVGSISSKKVNITVNYVFENGENVKCTIDHPLYVVDKGWSSFSNDLSNSLYNLETEVSKIEIGDIVKLYNGDTKITSIDVERDEVLVYNLQDIHNNHNFFANNVLVHNRSCFTADTKVAMEDGTFKNIVDIEVGDYVLSYKDGEYVRGIVTDKLTHPTNDVVEVVKYKGMVSDRLHPFYDNGEWKPIFEAEGVELGVQYVDNFYNLEIDGNVVDESEHNFIVEDFIVSGLGDNKLLNNTFKRQEIFQ